MQNGWKSFLSNRAHTGNDGKCKEMCQKQRIKWSEIMWNSLTQILQ